MHLPFVENSFKFVQNVVVEYLQNNSYDKTKHRRNKSNLHTAATMVGLISPAF
jgi:hypothetical protein